MWLTKIFVVGSMCANGSVVIVMSMVTVYLWSCRAVQCVCSRCCCFLFLLFVHFFSLLLVCFKCPVSLSNHYVVAQKRTLYGGFQPRNHSNLYGKALSLSPSRSRLLVPLSNSLLWCSSRSLLLLTTIFLHTNSKCNTEIEPTISRQWAGFGLACAICVRVYTT